jgi:hypothetical protein
MKDGRAIAGCISVLVFVPTKVDLDCICHGDGEAICTVYFMEMNLN